MTRARDALHLSWARSRQVFGQRRLTEKSRFLEELPVELLEQSGGAPASQPWRAERPAWARERAPAAGRDDASAPALHEAGAIRPGVRVRHPLFGVGTVLRREGEGEDFKVTVSFPGVGAKKLVARYAGLEVV
jgi:DNA helicase-2/ATP-dependent DNA helicase PcrA